jgi:hypothetical protein
VKIEELKIEIYKSFGVISSMFQRRMPSRSSNKFIHNGARIRMIVHAS